MSESTQTSRADLCDVKRCSCVVFPWKQEEKTWQTGLKFSLPTPPPNCSFSSWKMLYLDTRDMRNPVLHGKKQWGGGGGVGVGRENFSPVCQVFSSCFASSCHLLTLGLTEKVASSKWSLRSNPPCPFTTYNTDSHELVNEVRYIFIWITV